MPEKKKSSVTRKVERSTAEHEISKPGAGRAGGASHAGPGQVVQLPAGEAQLALFERAMRLFHARSLKEARELFVRAAAGPERDVAQRARLHVAMCDRRLERAAPVLNTAEDHYNYGIALINSRSIAAAREHLEIALRLSPGADHIHYALGLSQALAGDLAGAADNLRRAIELEPRNRIIARQDADLAPLAGQPPLDAVLYPEKKGW